ncbi:MAG: ATP-binding cassette domain-containing protein, partial [Halanaerobiales bacterium]|nr:ATP-binding cassette domain-containing protein [Halanaerobiales bacterium]
MTIKMRNIYKKYDQNYVLKDLSLDLNRGEIVGLVGKNGAGKTTLMKILCGNIVDFEGAVSYP